MEESHSPICITSKYTCGEINAFKVMVFYQEHIFQKHNKILARQSAILHIYVKKYSPLVIFQQEVALYLSAAKT